MRVRISASPEGGSDIVFAEPGILLDLTYRSRGAVADTTSRGAHTYL